jgi:hypothetical protein
MMSIDWRDKYTLWGRRAFIRDFGMVHTAASKSTSSHVASINSLTQQMRLRDVIVKVEGVEEFVLPATLTTHHSDALLSLDESRIGNPPEFCGVFQM